MELGFEIVKLLVCVRFADELPYRRYDQNSPHDNLKSSDTNMLKIRYYSQIIDYLEMIRRFSSFRTKKI